MATRPAPRTRVPALGRFSPAGLGRLENCPATVAANLVEDGFRARHARPLVAELLAVMLSAFQWATTHLKTNMFRLIVLIGAGTLLLAPLGSLLLARAAPLSTLVTATVELGLADAEAVRGDDFALVANRLRRCLATTAGDIDDLGAWRARAGVTLGLTPMPTS